MIEVGSSEYINTITKTPLTSSNRSSKTVLLMLYFKDVYLQAASRCCTNNNPNQKLKMLRRLVFVS